MTYNIAFFALKASKVHRIRLFSIFLAFFLFIRPAFMSFLQKRIIHFINEGGFSALVFSILSTFAIE